MLWGTNMEAMRITVVVPKQPSCRLTAEWMPPLNLCTVTNSTAGFVAWHLFKDAHAQSMLSPRTTRTKCH